MKITVTGHSEKAFAPDQIQASTTFKFHADSYAEALQGGVERVRNFITQIAAVTDFEAKDFKTYAYTIQERFHINQIAPTKPSNLDQNLQKRVSDGFFFTQYAHLEFNYDKVRLAKLLAIASQISDAPHLQVNFQLKNPAAKQLELIAEAYQDAQQKARTLADAAKQTLGECLQADLDRSLETPKYIERSATMFGATPSENEQLLLGIDETFQPDDIVLSKDIFCTWETLES